MKSLQVAKISVLIGLLSAGAWIFARSRAATQPSYVVSKELQLEPQQSPTSAPPFTVEKAGMRYLIEPVFDYDLHGLVVSSHDSSGWADVSHALWKDFLNTEDICVVWGRNLINGYLDEMSFHNEEFTCFVGSANRLAWDQFHMNQISNNHVLPATPEVEKALRRVAVGDEVHLQGQLVNYGREGLGRRMTSTTREDTGNGACEIVYVTSIETLARHNERWLRGASVLGWITILAGMGVVVSLLAAPFLIDD